MRENSTSLKLGGGGVGEIAEVMPSEVSLEAWLHPSPGTKLQAEGRERVKVQMARGGMDVQSWACRDLRSSPGLGQEGGHPHWILKLGLGFFKLPFGPRRGSRLRPRRSRGNRLHAKPEALNTSPDPSPTSHQAQGCPRGPLLRAKARGPL